MNQKSHPHLASLSNEVKQDLDLLIQQTDPINSLKVRTAIQPRTGANRDYRLPIPGTSIEKKYKNQSHTILVLKDGFEYEQKRYKSLSAIAKIITGSHWNGFNFFGLEKR